MQPTYCLNGGNLAGLPDYKVADLVIQNVPPETYASICVKSINYRFPLSNEDVKARQIFLQVSRLSVGWQSLKIFLEKMLGLHIERNIPIDKNLISAQLLGNYSENKDLHEVGIEEVKRAYAECMDITLIISEDCNFCELTLKQEKFYFMAKQAGQVAAFAISTGLTVANMAPKVFTLFKK